MNKKEKDPALFSLMEKEVQEFLQDLFAEGFFVTLVGGAVRDFLLFQQLSKDLDFELRTVKSLKVEEWDQELTNLEKRLKKEKGHQVSRLPFGILRVILGEYQLELGSPRTEFFQEHEYSHKNFKATISPYLPYEESLLRRDFTINAIGVEIRGQNQECWIDPLQGREDLKAKNLRPCGKNFTKDPVRFLRSIRFAQTLSWNWTPQFEKLISQFNLTQLGVHYFFYEGWKSRDFLQYVVRFYSLVDQHHLDLAFSLNSLRFLSKIQSAKPIVDKRGLLLQVIRAGSKLEDLQALSAALGCKYSLLEQYYQYFQIVELVQTRDFSRLKSSLAQGLTSDELALNEDFQFLLKGWSLRKRLLYAAWDFLKELENGKVAAQYFVYNKNETKINEISPALSLRPKDKSRSLLEFHHHLKSLWSEAKST